jgi:predicted permease
MVSFLTQPANLIVLKAIGRLFLISFLGYLAVRTRLLSAVAIQCLSKYVIILALPCLIISSLGQDLQYDLLGRMGYCLLAALLLNGFGLLAAFAARRLFLAEHQRGRRMFLTLSGLQNSGYLPIPLVLAILPVEQRAAGLLYVFSYMFVMSNIFWSLGVFLIVDQGKVGGVVENIRKIFNPPLIAMLISLFFLVPAVQSAYLNISLLSEVLTAVGDTTIPLVLIILGGSFASIAGERSVFLAAGAAAGLKLLAIPAITLLAAIWLQLDRIFAFVLILQAAMPAAMNHIVVAQEYDGDVAFASQSLFVQYLLSLFTVPLFLLLYNWLYA